MATHSSVPTPVFFPGESQGWGTLVGCRLWGHTESDTTEATQQQQQQQQGFFVCLCYSRRLMEKAIAQEGRLAGAKDIWEFGFLVKRTNVEEGTENQRKDSLPWQDQGQGRENRRDTRSV